MITDLMRRIGLNQTLDAQDLDELEMYFSRPFLQPVSELSRIASDLGRITGGEMAVGNPPPQSSSQGTGLWLDKNGLVGLNSGEQEAVFDASTGKITAGAGAVELGKNGITVFTEAGRTLDDGTSRTLSDGRTREIAVRTGAIEPDGDVSFGSNIDTAGTTGFKIFSNAQTYNGESMGAGDVLLGDNSATKANLLWDVSAGTLQLRQGTQIMAAIASGGFYQDGCEVRRIVTAQSCAVGGTYIQFDTETYDDSAYADLGSDNTKIVIPAGRGGTYECAFWVTSSGAGPASACYVRAAIEKNAAVAIGSGARYGAGDLVMLNGARDVVAAEGEYFQLNIGNGDTGAITLKATMSVRRVR